MNNNVITSYGGYMKKLIIDFAGALLFGLFIFGAMVLVRLV